MPARRRDEGGTDVSGKTAILAFDAAAAACSAALWRDGTIRAHRHAAMERGQAEALMPMIQAVMTEGGAPGPAGFAALAAIAVTVGPGSFTGLRIALAVARGLRLATGAPIVGVSTLAAVAAQVPQRLRHGPILAVLDSKRAELLYVQLFDADLVPLDAAEVLAPAELLAYAGAGALTVVGDASGLACAALPGPDVRPAGTPGVPDAADVARLAAALVAANGGRAEGAGLPASPVYLRAPDVGPAPVDP
ncbi:MAG: tRNA (adenosine(37)-N6)-threonylcarbamoyltransferase complex dimerization subunit type 1 TsaB [Rhodospirillaceae bacterium]|nr:tRNA (adenosine(37)-N6)-threonylcarbamoyltransferase complex dimerization subunit type 1 TsaB [Rhodospirillaceae bacterium]